MTTKPTSEHPPVIIYVEDNLGDALLLKEALQERHPHTVLEVIEDGAKALHYFEIKSKVKDIPPPHCILLDTHVPIVTGIQLLSFIRSAEVYRHIPIYIFATEADMRNAREAIRIPKECFLVKPAAWPGFLELADILSQKSERVAREHE